MMRGRTVMEVLSSATVVPLAYTQRRPMSYTFDAMKFDRWITTVRGAPKRSSGAPLPSQAGIAELKITESICTSIGNLRSSNSSANRPAIVYLYCSSPPATPRRPMRHLYVSSRFRIFSRGSHDDAVSGAPFTSRAFRAPASCSAARTRR